jgi:anti-sigma regulatory factor (Ser/Thr protein kinase)
MTAHWAAVQAEAGGVAPQAVTLLAEAVPRQVSRHRRPPRLPPGQFTATGALAAHPQSVKIARDFTRARLGHWGLATLADDAVLVVSELVTNAVQHTAAGRGGEPVVWVKLLAQPPCLMCLVADPSRDLPLRRPATAQDSAGRGLHVIESCSSRWGWHLLDEGGKVVWALLPRE